jgi:hypothetical protein
VVSSCEDMVRYIPHQGQVVHDVRYENASCALLSCDTDASEDLAASIFRDY